MLREIALTVAAIAAVAVMLFIPISALSDEIKEADARAKMHQDSANHYAVLYDIAVIERDEAREAYQAARADTVWLTRWRVHRDTLQVPVPAPADTQAMVEDYPRLLSAYATTVALADSLETWCVFTIGRCDEALKRDSAAADLTRRENEQLRASAEALQKRVNAMNRSRTLRDILIGTGSFSAGYTVCEIKN